MGLEENIYFPLYNLFVSIYLLHVLLLGFNPNALWAELNEIKGEPLMIPSFVYMYTV